MYSTYIFINRDVIVIKDYQKVGLSRSGIIQSLEGKSTGERTVPD